MCNRGFINKIDLQLLNVTFSSPDIPDDPDDVSPPPPPPEDIPAEAVDAVVPLDALYRVLHHGETAKGDSHRFSVTADPEDSTSKVCYNDNLLMIC